LKIRKVQKRENSGPRLKGEPEAPSDLLGGDGWKDPERVTDVKTGARRFHVLIARRAFALCVALRI
jgi:hypothetical protein